MSLHWKVIRSLILVLATATAPGFVEGQTMKRNPATLNRSAPLPEGTAYATLGAGCFWCIEAVFARIDGVLRVTSGFAGGHVENPTYRAVVSGNTGHAEVARIAFDPEVVNYAEILEVFWLAHDPTTLNRQGADIGTQYRSIILYEDDNRKAIAAASIAEAQQKFTDPIVTELVPLTTFYPAEDYHQDYFENNPNQPYCQMVIGPKLRKVEAALQSD